MMRILTRWIVLFVGLFAGWQTQVWAATYSNQTVAYNWIDASTHNRLSGTSAPYKLNGGGGCGTAPPVLDDTISDAIPIGFSFNFGGTAYTTLRIVTNGRIQFGNNTFCGNGTANAGPPQTYPYRYPDANVGASVRIYGSDLDPTPQGTAGYTTNCVVGSCYLSYALIGTAPNRQFVVTWNNVPEWIGTSKAGGNFNLQIILQENGDFIYQYGSNVHGASGTAEVGWQVTTADYDVPAFGLPGNNSAIKFFIPRPVAEYRMEQPSWAGVANEVIDTSGNGRHGTGVGANTTASGKVCRGAAITYNTVLATQSGISTPVNVGSLGGQGTITFWYKSSVAWNAANSEQQLLDASVAPGVYFFVTKRANGRLRFVLTDSANANQVVEVTANNSTAANTWRHIAVTWNFNALAAANSDRMRIFIDGAQAAQQTFTVASTLNPSVGNLFIGDSASVDSSSQSGTPKSVNGTIDEVRVYSFEAGVGLILRDMGIASCQGHYAIAAVAGSTCQATKITVTAHDGAHGLVTMPNNTTQITLTTSNGKGDWSLISGFGTLNNGVSDDGTATYLFNGEYQAVFGYTTSNSGTVNFDVTDGQLREDAGEDPVVTIGACNTSINACEVKSPRCSPASVADTSYAKLNTKLSSTAFNLDMVVLTTGAVVNTGFNGNVTVDLLANINAGVTVGSDNCPSSQTAVIPLGSIAVASGRATLPTTATTFSAVSPNYVAYRDVRVRFTCNAATCPPSGLTVCSTDNFAVRPQTFTVTSNMTNATLSGAPRLNAGADFTLTATAAAGFNDAAKIDGRVTISSSANCTTINDPGAPYANRVQSHDGLCTNRLVQFLNSAVTFPAAAPASGAATATVQFQDVGLFRILAGGVYDDTFTAVDQPGGCVAGSYSNTLSGGQYGCNIANVADTAFFGRFYPDHFALVAGSGTATSACVPATGTAFTYMGQSGMLLNYVIQAETLANMAANRYQVTSPTPSSPYLSFTASQLGAVDLVAVNGLFGTDRTSRISGWTTPSKNWVAGQQVATALPLSFSRQTTPDGPYNNLRFGARITGDQDGIVFPTAARNMVVGGASACSGAACTHVNLNPTTPMNVRFGVLRLSPGLGSELLPLLMPAQALYFDSTANTFLYNTDDSCTAVPSGFTYANWTKNLGAGETSVSGGLTLTGGRGNLRLTAPGAGNNGTVDVGVDLSGRTYLRGKWAGSANYDKDPAATAAFGYYKGARQVLNLQENY